MGKLDGYNVDLKGMTSDTVSYRWQADNDFFSAVQGSEIKAGSLDVALRVKQASGAYELEFQLKGEVEVTCDRCLEPMSQPIEAQCTLKDEFAALQIPLRHVHPDGECKAPLPTSSEEEKTDPRWDALKKIANRK